MNADHNANDPKDFHQRQVERFDFLMNRYLSGEASDAEEEELGQLVEKGFEKRFQEWLEAEQRTDSGTAKLSDKARREILSHIFDSKHPKTRRMPIWWGWAAAVLFILGGATWLAILDRQPEQIQLSRSQPVPQESGWRVVKGKQFLNLPDGSSVLMNENSELSYSPASFQGASREVELKGEAYFDITHNPKKPFLVKTGTVVTRVLGTSFNVNMNQNKVVVTVTRGLVEVGRKDQVYAKIRPDQQITVNTETEQYNTASVNAGKETAWKNAHLVLDNMDLEKAGQMIGTHYGVKLVFTRDQVKKCRITASFLNDEDLDTVLTVLSKMIGASYKKEGDTVTVEGGSCS